LQVTRSHVQNFLHSGPRVEQGEHQRSVSDPVGRPAINGGQDGRDFVGFQVVDLADDSAFRGHREEPLACLHVFGGAGGEESGEGMHRC
jgi:hypothetical protein